MRRGLVGLAILLMLTGVFGMNTLAGRIFSNALCCGLDQGSGWLRPGRAGPNRAYNRDFTNKPTSRELDLRFQRLEPVNHRGQVERTSRREGLTPNQVNL